jgi:hypothetical protein
MRFRPNHTNGYGSCGVGAVQDLRLVAAPPFFAMLGGSGQATDRHTIRTWEIWRQTVDTARPTDHENAPSARSQASQLVPPRLVKRPPRCLIGHRTWRQGVVPYHTGGGTEATSHRTPTQNLASSRFSVLHLGHCTSGPPSLHGRHCENAVILASGCVPAPPNTRETCAPRLLPAMDSLQPTALKSCACTSVVLLRRLARNGFLKRQVCS